MLTEYTVGVRFQPIGTPDQTKDAAILMKHWAIVFTPTLDATSSRVLELVNRKDSAIAMHTADQNSRLEASPLAKYTGMLSDTDTILRAHPMRGSQYSACFNNCQHFVATFLLLLQAFALQKDDRSYSIIDSKLMERVIGVLEKSSTVWGPGTQLHHAPNPFLQTVQLTPLPFVGGVATGAASLAGESTIFAEIMSVVAPAAYATAGAAAASAAVVTVGAGLVIGFWCIQHIIEWGEATSFNDPRHHGFPRTPRPPLTKAEQGLDGNMARGENIGLIKYSTSSYQGSLASYEEMERIAQTLQKSSPLTIISTMGGLMLLRDMN